MNDHAQMAAIHICAPLRAKLFALLAFGWTLVWMGFTVTVHFIELTVARQIDLAANPALRRLFEFKWPSLLYGIEITAWNLFFGLRCCSPVPHSKVAAKKQLSGVAYWSAAVRAEAAGVPPGNPDDRARQSAELHRGAGPPPCRS